MPRKQIKLSVPPEFHDELEKRAEEKGLPLATYIRKFLASEFKIKDSTREYDYEADQINDMNKEETAVQTPEKAKQPAPDPKESSELILLSDIIEQARRDEIEQSDQKKNYEVDMSGEVSQKSQENAVKPDKTKDSNKPNQINITINL
jgi:hypothetical protein